MRVAPMESAYGWYSKAQHEMAQCYHLGCLPSGKGVGVFLQGGNAAMPLFNAAVQFLLRIALNIGQ
jgi:hypothetical protein